MWNGEIKVITGIRRCGKSVLLFDLFYEYLLSQGVDEGHIMENIIYNELLRRGYSVDVGMVCDRAGNSKIQREIDFVVNDADRKIYIQSAFRMDTDKKRILGAVIADAYQGFLQKDYRPHGCAAQFL